MSYGSPDYDMDSFLNFDQEFYSPTDSYPTNSGFASNNVLPTSDHRDDVNAFPGPSHEYGRFKQLTGLPSGGMANLAAIDEMDSFPNSQMNSQTGLFDMDFEPSQQAMPAFLFQESSNPNGFVNPSAIQATRTRQYPGVHTQAAEHAKAQAVAEQKRRQEHGQHIMRQRQQPQQQLAAPANPDRHRSSSSSRSDPAVEERISRLLDQMRHNSTASSADIEALSQNGDQDSARMSKMKKDEEEMDEDERLLASEEGKKLSSKERRQLRNKVSARAFRSRRKEYIGQLEGEVATKSQETNELRAQIRQLQAQNQQLTQLTQTLLRHPAFSTFLEDMSNDPTIIAPVEEQQNESVNDTDSEQQSQHRESIKQENDQQHQSHHQQHELEVNMATVPPTPLDFSMLNLGNNHWGSSHIGSHFRQPQVFTVTNLPQGPSFEELRTTNEPFHNAPAPTSLLAKLPWYQLSNDNGVDMSDR